MIEVREVPYGSTEYDEVVELRREVLRRPLGLDFTKEQLASEAKDWHFAAYDNDLVGSLILTARSKEDVQMRQVAVSFSCQRRGVGRALIEEAESFAVEHGFTKMILHARQTAVPFYEALGYTVEDEPFEEVGLPHRSMFKRLVA